MVEQLSLTFEPGISRKHLNFLACCSHVVYKAGHGNVALELDDSPGNLTKKLSVDDTRKFGVDDLEKFLDKFKDLEPIYYLIDKYLKDKETHNTSQLIGEVHGLMSELRLRLDALNGATP